VTTQSFMASSEESTLLQTSESRWLVRTGA
jgi:hypothetical protein